MIVTAKEAEAMLCGETMGVPPVYTPEGYGVREGGPFPCHGPRCMHWRWLGWRNKDGGIVENRPAYAIPGEWINVGYCGKSGKP